jgi:Secretion system C-terminal sorting domain
MKIILLSILFISTIGLSQDAAKNWCVPIAVSTSDSPAEITLTWTENAASGTQYLVFRKLKGNNGWGSSIGSVPSGDSVFVDNTVSIGVSYEYLVQKVGGSTLYSWGYVNAGIKSELPYNRGDLLILLDSTYADSLITELTQLEMDLYNDSWMVKTLIIGPSLTPVQVKAQIQNEYDNLPNLKTVYLLGHIPVPYSGNLNPDAHPEHEGAWPADAYYADLDGVWTDVTINNSVATDPRNFNIPGDGKFDQSKVPSTLELEVCRVDFYDLPTFAESELDLLKNYLNKAHDFKIATYVPIERALYDQGGFVGMAEGFAQSGIRNFVPFVGHDSLFEIDYFSNLTVDSYLWSYGCGAGSYTSVAALDNGTSLTSSELATTDMQAVFTMLFGSYFGDWDRSNNLMRSALANGKTLSISWAGRPNWHYHIMAQGDHLGASAMMSMDKNTDYLSLNLGGGFVTWEGVHVSQLGDPSLRTYYVEPPSNLTIVNSNNDADLSWNASADGSIDGYNIYRRTSSSLWSKVNSSIIVGTLFTDTGIPFGDEYEYMVKAVKLKTNGSGSFYNESLGTTNSEIFTVGIEEAVKVEIGVYPIPAETNLTVTSNVQLSQITMISALGQIVWQNNVNGNSTELDVSELPPGMYVLMIQTEAGLIEKQIVKK